MMNMLVSTEGKGWNWDGTNSNIQCIRSDKIIDR